MENCMMTSPQLIADSYERYHFSVYLYIYNKVNNKEEAGRSFPRCICPSDGL